jgi:hypothetical protein
MKAESVMSQRIEDVLSGRRTLKRKPPKRRVGSWPVSVRKRPTGRNEGKPYAVRQEISKNAFLEEHCATVRGQLKRLGRKRVGR